MICRRALRRNFEDTPVFVGSDIRESRFRKDLAKSMRVERVSDQARNQKFKVKDERQESQQADTGRKPEVDQGRKQDMGRVTAEATKGNKEAQRQTRQLEQQQRKDTRVQAKTTRAQAPAQQKTTRAQAPAQQKTTRAQAPAQQKTTAPGPAQPAKPRPKLNSNRSASLNSNRRENE